MNILGRTIYKDVLAQQHDDVFNIFKEFINDIRPDRILEIGTSHGGFTLFLRDTLDEIGLTSSKIKSFDVHEQKWYNSLREKNIEIIVQNIFTDDYSGLKKPNLVVPFIQDEGVTLVLCDGGSKQSEFNILTRYLKTGDFIMAHDYVDNYENFKTNYKNKIWNWFEIEDKSIEVVSKEYNLQQYNKENFDKVVWVCKKKV